MKKIPEPKLNSATLLKAAEMNSIHFAGNNTPVASKPLQIKNNK